MKPSSTTAASSGTLQTCPVKTRRRRYA